MEGKLEIIPYATLLGALVDDGPDNGGQSRALAGLLAEEDESSSDPDGIHGDDEDEDSLTEEEISAISAMGGPSPSPSRSPPPFSPLEKRYLEGDIKLDEYKREAIKEMVGSAEESAEQQEQEVGEGEAEQQGPDEATIAL